MWKSNIEKLLFHNVGIERAVELTYNCCSVPVDRDIWGKGRGILLLSLVVAITPRHPTLYVPLIVLCAPNCNVKTKLPLSTTLFVGGYIWRINHSL